MGVALAVAHVLTHRTPLRLRVLVLAASAAGLVNLAMYVVVFEVIEFWRYTYAIRGFLLVVCYGTLMIVTRRDPRPGPWRIAAGLLVTVMVLAAGARGIMGSRDLPEVARGVIHGRTRFNAAEYNEYQRAQAAIPAGASFLCFVEWPLLFDLARNPMYCPDNIGSVSPPPGVPLNGRPEDLVEYLRGLGIQYVVCPSTSECESWAVKRAKEADSYLLPADKLIENLWCYSLLSNQVKAYRLFAQIASTHKLLYDDGKIAVIDLHHAKTPSTGVTP